MSLQLNIPATCWLSPAAEVRGSAIEGLGLFALRDISASAPIMQLGGRIIDDRTLGGLTPPYSSLCVGEGIHILIDPAHPVRYGNHSCDPNLWHEGATTIIARRDIARGEELTVDYATHTISPSWSMTCRCGSPLCRTQVTGNDWQLPDLQDRYGHHWTPPLNAAIGRRDRGSTPGLIRAVLRELEHRREARMLLDEVAKHPELYKDVGINYASLRDDVGTAVRLNSSLSRYLNRVRKRLFRS